MSEWKETEFYKVLVDESISYGIVQPGSHIEEESVPIIRVQNIKNGHIDISDIKKVSKSIADNYKRTSLVGGELLITVVGSIGECAIVPKELKGWNVARAVSVARIKNEYDVKFIRYAFETEETKFQMYGNTNDTVQPTLNLKELKNLKLFLPSLSEQKAIAGVLSSLDDKIDLLHRQNKTLEAMAETLFRQWFIEEADEGWEEKNLASLIDIGSGKGLKKEKFIEDGEYPVLGANGKIGNTDSWLFEGELIFTGRVGTLGNIFIINKNVKVWLSDNTLVIKPNKYFYYIYFILKGVKLEEYNVGSTQPLIRQSDIKAIEVSVPTENIITEFENIVIQYFNKIQLNNNQIRTLEKLRDILLPKLMSGEMRVKL